MKALVKTRIDTVFDSDSDSSSSSSSSNGSSSSISSSENSAKSTGSAECSGKLWRRPHRHHHHHHKKASTNEEYSDKQRTHELMNMNQDASFFYAMAKERPSDKHHRPSNKLTVTGSSSDATNRRQTKLLLVSLIESLCQTYGDTPESTRKIFLMICQTLSSLGFIDSEFIDEVAGVRSTYHKAFEQLFYTAAQTVRQQELRLGTQPRLLTSAQQQEILKEKIESLSGSYSSTSSVESLEDVTPLKYSLSIQQSRYRNDFVEVDMLGRGGFASAWRARNKLDDIEYAIKKIRLVESEDEDYAKIFREIKNLARLEHHNVVRYYSSWLEYAASVDEQHHQDDQDELSWLSSRSSAASQSNDDNSSIFNGQDPTFEPSEDSLNNNKPTTAEEMSFITFGTSDNEPTESDNNNVYLQASSSTSTIKKFHEPEKGGFILFIQMQLCPSTLHEYIKFRNQNPTEYFDHQQNIDLFSQILQGCAYIHQQGLIHRDLKPSNIFLSRPATVPEHRYRHPEGLDSECKCCEAMVPKIGDFGLAANVFHTEDDLMDDEDGSYLATTFDSQHSHSSSVIELFASSYQQHQHQRESNGGSSSHSDSTLSLHPESFKSKGSRPRLRRNRTSGVGTRTYAAPEQLASSCHSYDEKADIYSLGIILFELCNPFSSAMERAIAIDQLKKGIFPDTFTKAFPVERDIIMRMIQPDPCLRPTALELLDLDIFKHQQHTTEYLTAAEQLNVIHDREMAEMRDRYSQMKQEKEDLQRRLDELESKLNYCNVAENKIKRQHEQETEYGIAKKQESNSSVFQSNLLAKFMMPN